MADIDAKIISATKNGEEAIIVVEFADAKGKWQKTYKQRQSVINANGFKKLLESDLKKDLKRQDQLEEITPLIGTKFTIKV